MATYGLLGAAIEGSLDNLASVNYVETTSRYRSEAGYHVCTRAQRVFGFFGICRDYAI